MLKQGIKTIDAEFIRACAMSQIFFVQFRPYAFHSVQNFCSLLPRVSSLFDVNVKKKKRPSKRIWTLCLHSRPLLTIDAKIKGLVSNVDY